MHAVWFSQFHCHGRISSSKDVLNDAYNRLGDCYFVQMQYTKAVQYYDIALKTGTGTNDYALVPESSGPGGTGKDNEKISCAEQLLISTIPNSAYKADVYFQMAESYVKLNQTDKAITNYRKVISDYPKSSYVKKSLLGWACSILIQNRNNDAIACYKKVIEDYPGTEEAENAMIGLEECICR